MQGTNIEASSYIFGLRHQHCQIIPCFSIFIMHKTRDHPTPASSGVLTSRINATMIRRRVNQLKVPLHRRTDDEERLLSAIELYEYPLDGITNAAPPAHNAPEALKTKFQLYPHETLSFNRLRHIASSLNIERLGSYVDALKSRPRQHSRSQWVISRDSEELECCDPVNTSSETQMGEAQGKDRIWKSKRRSKSDTGLRSTVDWCFWSLEAVKNCPSLEFLRIHLAPTNIWL